MNLFLLQIQTHTKGSTLSSGARAAAQTLNVPIERLEQSIQLHSPGHIASPGGGQHHEQRMNGHSQHNNNNHHHQHQIDEHHQQIIERDSVSPPNGYPAQYVHRKNSISHQDSIISTTNGTNQDQDGSPTHPTQATSVTKHSLLQFAIQHFRNE